MYQNEGRSHGYRLKWERLGAMSTVKENYFTDCSVPESKSNRCATVEGNIIASDSETMFGMMRVSWRCSPLPPKLNVVCGHNWRRRKAARHLRYSFLTPGGCPPCPSDGCCSDISGTTLRSGGRGVANMTLWRHNALALSTCNISYLHGTGGHCPGNN